MPPYVTPFAVAGFASQAGFGGSTQTNVPPVWSDTTPHETITNDQGFTLPAKGTADYKRLQTAVAISFAEDPTRDVGATHHNSDGSTDSGLWQINSVHSEYDPQKLTSDPLYNAVAAFRISNGGTSFGPWTTYRDGAYLTHMAAAAGAIETLRINGPTAFESFAGSASNVLGSWTDGLKTLLGNLTSGSFWKRIGFGAIGTIMVLFALILIFRR